MFILSYTFKIKASEYHLKEKIFSEINVLTLSLPFILLVDQSVPCHTELYKS